MPAVARFDPFRDITTLRDEMNRLFNRDHRRRSLVGVRLDPGGGHLRHRSGDRPARRAPRADPDDIDIEIDDNVLSLKGERRFEETVQEGRYYRLERAYGHFQRNVTLPQGVKADEISATFDKRRAQRPRAEGRRGPARARSPWRPPPRPPRRRGAGRRQLGDAGSSETA